MQGALDWHPAPKPVLEAAIAARQKAASHGVDIGTLAIKEAVRPKGIAVNLVGMRTPDEARSLLLHISACLSLCHQQPHEHYNHESTVHWICIRLWHDLYSAGSNPCTAEAEQMARADLTGL